MKPNIVALPEQFQIARPNLLKLRHTRHQ